MVASAQETHEVADWGTPYGLDPPHAPKISGFSCHLTALQKIKQLHAITVEMQLGVSGALVATFVDC